MPETKILIPMPKSDKRYKNCLARHTKLREELVSNEHKTLESLYKKAGCRNIEDYYSTIRAGLQRPKVLLEREIKDSYVNVYNPWVLRELQSNTDIQFILDEYSCAQYVVEYVNKVNRGISDLHRRLFELQEAQPDLDTKELHSMIGTEVLNSVEMSAQEAAWYLLRQPMSEASRKCLYIPTVWPDERQKITMSREEMNKRNIADDSYEVFKDDLIDKYSKRIDEFSKLTLAQYTARLNSNQTERKQNAIIRYRNYETVDKDNFMREMVLLHVPWSDELKEIIEFDSYKAIYETQIETISKNREEFENYLDFEKTLQHCKDMCQELEEEENGSIKRKCLAEEEGVFKRPKKADLDLSKSYIDKRISMVRQRENVPSHEEYCKKMRQTNEEQRAILLQIIYHLSDMNDDQLLGFLTGPAGCGKTFTIDLIKETYNRFTQTNSNAYIATASTGKAAFAIQGMTVHSALDVNVRKPYPLSHQRLQVMRNEIKEVKVLLVDECSMIGSDALVLINERLQQMTGIIDRPFGGLDVIMIGDLYQLPPVKAPPIYKPNRRNISGSPLWAQFKIHELKQVIRQSDLTFSNALTKLGSGEMLTEEERALFQSRFTTEEACKEEAKDAVRLFFNNNKVEAYNLERQDKEGTVNCIAEDKGEGDFSTEQLENMRQELHKQKISDTKCLPYNIKLLLGENYMVTNNVDISDGLVNGAIGTLVHMDIEPISAEDINAPPVVNIIWLHFTDPKIGVRQRIKTAGYRSDQKYPETWTPILKQTARVFTHVSKKAFIKRKQFPLVGCAAMTIHKSQGASFDDVVYNYSKSHSLPLVYVALSRAKTLEGLHITTDETKFYHGSEKPGDSSVTKEVTKELNKLRESPLKTIQQTTKELVQNAQVSIITHNTQSLRAHLKDLETDVVFKSAMIYSFSETWLSDEESVDIEGFKCISKSKRQPVRAGGVALYCRAELYNFCLPVVIPLVSTAGYATDVGDLCAMTFQRNNIGFMIVAVYISPGTGTNDACDFLIQYLSPWSLYVAKLMNAGNNPRPMILCGDFNIDFSTDDGKRAVGLLKEHFDLEASSSLKQPTTRNGTVIDGVFSRYLEKTPLLTSNYISYYSHHMPHISCINN